MMLTSSADSRTASTTMPHAAGLVVQRQGQWHDLIAVPDPAHQVSALVAVEDGRNHVDGID
ncbi:MAG: hypothetical protein ABSE84_20560 [Isosphaeraceae bacterium]